MGFVLVINKYTSPRILSDANKTLLFIKQANYNANVIFVFHLQV
jgi:hypothetical protein